MKIFSKYLMERSTKIVRSGIYFKWLCMLNKKGKITLALSNRSDYIFVRRVTSPFKNDASPNRTSS